MNLPYHISASFEFYKWCDFLRGGWVKSDYQSCIVLELGLGLDKTIPPSARVAAMSYMPQQNCKTSWG